MYLDLDNSELVESNEFWITVYELGDIDEVTLIDRLLDNYLAIESLLDIYERPGKPCQVIRTPGALFSFQVAFTGEIVHGKIIWCISNGPWKCRPFPYYWDRFGSRHLYWRYKNKDGQMMEQTFYDLYIAQTPKNR